MSSINNHEIIVQKLAELKLKTTELIKELCKVYNYPNLYKLAILSSFSNTNLYVEKTNRRNHFEGLNLLNKLFENSRPFYIKFNEKTFSENFLGIIDKSKLSTGEYSLKTIGFAPSSNFVFMEDVSKCNKYLINNVDEFVNKRRFTNNNKYEDICSVLNVIYDDISLNDSFFETIHFNLFEDHENFTEYMFNGFSTIGKIKNKYLLSDISAVNKLVEHVKIPLEVENILEEFEKRLSKERKLFKKEISLNPHKKIIYKVMKICAILNGRLEVNITDCFFIHNLLAYDKFSEKIISNLFNDVSSRIEYEIKYDSEEIIRSYGNLISSIKEELILKSFNSKVISNKVYENLNGKYYLYSFQSAHDKESKMFLPKEVVDDVFVKTYFGEIIPINAITFDQFLNADKIGHTLFFMFNNENNTFIVDSVSGEKKEIFPSLIENNVNKISNKNINHDSLKEIKKYAIVLVNKIDICLQDLEEQVNLDFNSLLRINPLILTEDMDFYKKPIIFAISKLKFLKSSINEIFANLKLFVQDNNFDKMNNFTKMFLL